ncbi:MAG: helix-hairpin-helix domain-containing protein [Bacilli bacterium]|nr:helix-hairpin-helix domain-containing protein [Bacilli bacterium]
MFKIIIGVIIAGILAIGAFMILDPNIKIANSTQDPTVDTTNTFQVSIEGEIFKSGTYTLQEGATMNDLITAAGGLTNNADEYAFFEDAVLTKGQSYYIAPKFDVGDICNQNEIKKVNINSDESETLLSVNGFTTSIVSSIISYRTENGAFSTIEALMDVYGIGNATYRKVRNYVILHK